MFGWWGRAAPVARLPVGGVAAELGGDFAGSLSCVEEDWGCLDWGAAVDLALTVCPFFDLILLFKEVGRAVGVKFRGRGD